MDHSVINAALAPFLGKTELSSAQISQISEYLNLLVSWNARVNLTAVRTPEEMLTRHFGESFFAAELLLREFAPKTAIDYGSGAGFPGLPLAVFAPELCITLVEAHNKKSVFLKEVIRALGLKNVTVFTGRAESSGLTADLVLMRAVEKFAAAVPAAAKLLAPGGRLTLLIGSAQVDEAKRLLPDFHWMDVVKVPQSNSRVLLIGQK